MNLYAKPWFMLVGGLVVGAAVMAIYFHWDTLTSIRLVVDDKKAPVEEVEWPDESTRTALEQAKPTTAKVAAAEVKPYPGITWELSEIGVDALGTPVTSVNVKTKTQTYLVGNFSGSCTEIAGSGWSLVGKEKSGVICWWAGGGTEVGVFEEKGKFIVKAGDIEEGTAETPGARGNFETLFEISL